MPDSYAFTLLLLGALGLSAGLLVASRLQLRVLRAASRAERIDELDARAALEVGAWDGHWAALERRQLRGLVDEAQGRADGLQRTQDAQVESNAALKHQDEALRSAHAQLTAQKEELEMSNAGLERQKAELVRLSLEVARKAEELARTNRFKSEFVANMSHELRTPLNSLLVLAKLLAENPRGNLDAEQVKYAETIYGAGRDLLAQIDDILDSMKIEAHRVEVALGSIDIAGLVADMRGMFAPMAQAKGLAFEAAGVEGAFESDRKLVVQILRNLLANAIKFTPAGRVAMRVELTGLLVLFVVEDSGVGILADQREIIFEAFRQANGTTKRQFGGTGLGLSIARDLAHLLGGDVTVESRAGAGSAFTLSLPRVRGLLMSPSVPPPGVGLVEHLERHEPRAKSSWVPDGGAVLGGHTLLLAETDVRVVFSVTAQLEALGAKVVAARTSAQAVELVERRAELELLLVGGKLPGLDAEALIQSVRRRGGRYAALPILAFVDESEPGAQDRLVAAGASACLATPVDPERLSSLLRSLLPDRESIDETRLPGALLDLDAQAEERRWDRRS